MLLTDPSARAARSSARWPGGGFAMLYLVAPAGGTTEETSTFELVLNIGPNIQHIPYCAQLWPGVDQQKWAYITISSTNPTGQ